MSSLFDKLLGLTRRKPWLSRDIADRCVLEVLNRVGAGEGIEAEAAWKALSELNGRQLLEADEEFRSQSYYFGPQKRGLLTLADGESNPDRAAAYRFAAACSADGYLRQDALSALRGRDTRLGMAAAMIRRKDWVPEIRAEADGSLVEYLRGGSPPLFFGLYDLHMLLERRRRDVPSEWSEWFERILLSPDSRDERWKATFHAERWIRRAAFELVLRADENRRQETLLRGVADRACSIALWSLDQAVLASAKQPVAPVLDVADRHRHPAVRAQSLRLRNNEHPDPVRLRMSLLDRSRSVRNAAAYLLRTRVGESALPTWRKVVDATQSPDFTIAASALAEHAEPADLDRLRGLLDDRAARLRSMALRGLVRLKAESLPTHLAHALGDSSPRVLREAIRAYETGSEQLGPEQLEAAYSSAGTKARIALLNAARTLGKWGELAFLMARAVEGDPELNEFLRPHLDRWYGHANSSYTPILEGRRGVLLSALERARLAMPAYRWDAIRAMI